MQCKSYLVIVQVLASPLCIMYSASLQYIYHPCMHTVYLSSVHSLHARLPPFYCECTWLSSHLFQLPVVRVTDHGTAQDIEEEMFQAAVMESLEDRDRLIVHRLAVRYVHWY